jgi:hypothetical protein
MHIGNWRESQEEAGQKGDQDASGWIIFKCILKRQDMMIWIGFMWLRTGEGGGLL